MTSSNGLRTIETVRSTSLSGNLLNFYLIEISVQEIKLDAKFDSRILNGYYFLETCQLQLNPWVISWVISLRLLPRNTQIGLYSQRFSIYSPADYYFFLRSPLKSIQRKLACGKIKSSHGRIGFSNDCAVQLKSKRNCNGEQPHIQGNALDNHSGKRFDLE